MTRTTDTRPYYNVYGDTSTSGNDYLGAYRTFEEAKIFADELVKQGRILVHIRRVDYDSDIDEPELVVWACASPEMDWR